eukprot:365791-Chlamydomonas_euryale.AAC.4
MLPTAMRTRKRDRPAGMGRVWKRVAHKVYAHGLQGALQQRAREAMPPLNVGTSPFPPRCQAAETTESKQPCRWRRPLYFTTAWATTRPCLPGVSHAFTESAMPS